MNIAQAVIKNRKEVNDMARVPELELYTIRDLKSEYTPPVAINNKDVARRWFKTQVKNDKTIKDNPGDFDLYYVGKFDPVTGDITDTAHEYICNGKEFE